MIKYTDVEFCKFPSQEGVKRKKNLKCFYPEREAFKNVKNMPRPSFMP
jgi:hypothetical protein